MHLKSLLMHPKDKIPTQLCQLWFITGPILMKTAILLTLEIQADGLRAGSKNTIPHLLVHYSNIAQTKTTLKLLYPI